jgi:hypothetical protein
LDMMSWMTNQYLEDTKSLVQRPSRLTMANPLEALFRIVFLDTMTLSDIVDNRLQEIRLASQGGSELEASIGAWRWMLMQAQLRLPILRTTITDLTRKGPLRPQPSRQSPDFWLLVARVRQRISAVIARADEIDAALRAELSILESRKQLNESSSISRLTELAFVFVPMSFIASAFSMQVQELQPPPHLTTFVLAAFIAVFFAYMVRLFFNSRIFGKGSRRIQRAARKHGQIQDGQAVPAGLYLTFFLSKVPLYFFSIYGIILACSAPVVWLWVDRGDVDSGFKAVLTVVVILTLPLSTFAS